MAERARFPLDRLLSRLGAASRAEAGRLIREGLVRVHGRVVRDPARAFGLKDPVEVLRDGAWTKAEAPAVHRYAAWHKPAGVVVSARDERGRADLASALPPELEGCFAAGRLDMDSEGLLLLTDDGAFADAAVAPGGPPSATGSLSTPSPATRRSPAWRRAVRWAAASKWALARCAAAAPEKPFSSSTKARTARSGALRNGKD